jgi:hypothetical protein
MMNGAEPSIQRRCRAHMKFSARRVTCLTLAWWKSNLRARQLGASSRSWTLGQPIRAERTRNLISAGISIRCGNLLSAALLLGCCQRCATCPNRSTAGGGRERPRRPRRDAPPHAIGDRRQTYWVKSHTHKYALHRETPRPGAWDDAHGRSRESAGASGDLPRRATGCR